MYYILHWAFIYIIFKCLDPIKLSLSSPFISHRGDLKVATGLEQEQRTNR